MLVSGGILLSFIDVPKLQVIGHIPTGQYEAGDVKTLLFLLIYLISPKRYGSHKKI